jgi:hypothetical protein
MGSFSPSRRYVSSGLTRLVPAAAPLERRLLNRCSTQKPRYRIFPQTVLTGKDVRHMGDSEGDDLMEN